MKGVGTPSIVLGLARALTKDFGLWTLTLACKLFRTRTSLRSVMFNNVSHNC